MLLVAALFMLLDFSESITHHPQTTPSCCTGLFTRARSLATPHWQAAVRQAAYHAVTQRSDAFDGGPSLEARIERDRRLYARVQEALFSQPGTLDRIVGSPDPIAGSLVDEHGQLHFKILDTYDCPEPDDVTTLVTWHVTRPHSHQSDLTVTVRSAPAPPTRQNHHRTPLRMCTEDTYRFSASTGLSHLGARQAPRAGLVYHFTVDSAGGSTQVGQHNAERRVLKPVKFPTTVGKKLVYDASTGKVIISKADYDSPGPQPVVAIEPRKRYSNKQDSQKTYNLRSDAEREFITQEKYDGFLPVKPHLENHQTANSIILATPTASSTTAKYSHHQNRDLNKFHRRYQDSQPPFRPSKQYTIYSEPDPLYDNPLFTVPNNEERNKVLVIHRYHESQLPAVIATGAQAPTPVLPFISVTVSNNIPVHSLKQSDDSSGTVTTTRTTTSHRETTHVDVEEITVTTSGTPIKSTTESVVTPGEVTATMKSNSSSSNDTNESLDNQMMTTGSAKQMRHIIKKDTTEANRRGEGAVNSENNMSDVRAVNFENNGSDVTDNQTTTWNSDITHKPNEKSTGSTETTTITPEILTQPIITNDTSQLLIENFLRTVIGGNQTEAANENSAIEETGPIVDFAQAKHTLALLDPAQMFDINGGLVRNPAQIFDMFDEKISKSNEEEKISDDFRGKMDKQLLNLDRLEDNATQYTKENKMDTNTDMSTTVLDVSTQTSVSLESTVPVDSPYSAPDKKLHRLETSTTSPFSSTSLESSKEDHQISRDTTTSTLSDGIVYSTLTPSINWLNQERHTLNPAIVLLKNTHNEPIVTEGATTTERFESLEQNASFELQSKMLQRQERAESETVVTDNDVTTGDQSTAAATSGVFQLRSTRSGRSQTETETEVTPIETTSNLEQNKMKIAGNTFATEKYTSLTEATQETLGNSQENTQDEQSVTESTLTAKITTILEQNTPKSPRTLLQSSRNERSGTQETATERSTTILELNTQESSTNAQENEQYRDQSFTTEQSTILKQDSRKSSQENPQNGESVTESMLTTEISTFPDQETTTILQMKSQSGRIELGTTSEPNETQETPRILQLNSRNGRLELGITSEPNETTSQTGKTSQEKSRNERAKLETSQLADPTSQNGNLEQGTTSQPFTTDMTTFNEDHSSREITPQDLETARRNLASLLATLSFDLFNNSQSQSSILRVRNGDGTYLDFESSFNSTEDYDEGFEEDEEEEDDESGETVDEEELFDYDSIPLSAANIRRRLSVGDNSTVQTEGENTPKTSSEQRRKVIKSNSH